MIILVYFKLSLAKIIILFILFFVIKSNISSAQLINDINEATVFTINEYISDEYGINLASKVKSQVLIRAWFKWMKDLDYKKYAWYKEYKKILVTGKLFLKMQKIICFKLLTSFKT